MCEPPTDVDNKSRFTPENANVNAGDKTATCGNDELYLARQTLKRGTFLACVSILILLMGLSTMFPLLQGRRDELGCDSLCFGTMTSARSALGLVGTAAVGRLSDKNGSLLARSFGALGESSGSSGRRAALYLGTIASLIGLAISASMNSLRGLWLSMIPGALLQHNFDVFKALVSEYHNDIEHLEGRVKDNIDDGKPKDGNSQTGTSARSGSVGKLGMSVGISFMIGPMIAAMAAPTFQVAAQFAILCALASGIAIFYLPLPALSAQNQRNDIDVHDKKSAGEQKSEFTFINMVKLQTPKSRAASTLIVIRLNMALAFHIFNTVWPASLRARFDFGPSDYAKFMSFIGVTYAFSQGVLAKRLVQLWGKEGKVYIIMACCALLGAGRYVAFYTGSLLVIYATFFLVINALGTMNTVITADTGSIAPSNEIGGLFGILQAAESAAGMLGPVLGGVISNYIGKDAPLIAVVCVYGFLFAFISWGYERHVTSCNTDGVKGEGSEKIKKWVKSM